MDTLVHTMVPILVIVVVGVLFLAFFLKNKKGRLSAGNYQRNNELFSPAELAFLAALDRALDPGQRAFGKVRLADLVLLRSGLSPKLRQAALNRVAQKHVDFVVCAGSKLEPVCAVELNDSSHGSNRAKRRDEFLSLVCGQVGLPLVTVKAAGSYAPESIRQQIAAAMKEQEGRRANVAQQIAAANRDP